jgi:hypothetical protein
MAAAINGELLLMLYGCAFLIGVMGLMLFLVKTDVINKLKLMIGSSKGAKLFHLYKKDGSEEDFVDSGKPGGVIKHDGDPYAITFGTIFTNRAKNAPAVTLIEGNLSSVNPLMRGDARVDTKQLRALFFAEREKAKSDLNPDVKLLKMLVIGALIACGIAVVIAYFNYDTAQKTLATLGPISQYYNAIMPHGGNVTL